MTRRPAAALAALAVVPVLVGCTAVDEPDPADGASQPSSGVSPKPEAATHFVTAPGGGEGAEQALLDGRLRLDGGCLIVRQERGEGRVKAVVPVFLDTMSPRWEEQSRTLTVGGREYAAGERVSFGGGMPTRARIQGFAVPEKCADRRPYFVVQHLIDWDELD